MAMKNNGVIVMKLKKLLIFAITMILLFSIWCIPAYAEHLYMEEMYETEELTEEEYERFISMLCIQVLDEDPNKGEIVDFAVNSNGSYVVSLENYNQKYIVVYDQNNVFQYGFAMRYNGMLDVFWLNEHEPVIKFSRGYDIASFDKNGNCIFVKNVVESVETSMLDNDLNNIKRISENSTYELKINKIVKIDSNENETVIYTGEADGPLSNIIISLLLLLGGVPTVITVIVVSIVKYQKSLEVKDGDEK